MVRAILVSAVLINCQVNMLTRRIEYTVYVIAFERDVKYRKRIFIQG